MKTPSPFKLRYVFMCASLFALIFFVSCSQENDSNELENLNASAAKASKGKKVAKHISGRLSNFADPNQLQEDVLLCFPEEFLFPLTRNVLSGHMKHLGKLQAGVSDPVTGEVISGSFGNPISCDINLETFAELSTIYEVTYVAANGDSFYTTEQVTISFPNTFVDEDGNTQIDYSTGFFGGSAGFEHAIIIEGGKGRFEGASGYMDFMNAEFGPDGSTWDLVGEIIY
ncbi:hypothetical protein [Muriicola sp.]|uniref:hypothetical protein n=1 Tax=Muriicola sp. TaxID=2020856 RepID=UPI003C78C234